MDFLEAVQFALLRIKENMRWSGDRGHFSGSNHSSKVRLIMSA